MDDDYTDYYTPTPWHDSGFGGNEGHEEIIPGVQITRADRKSCIVCGSRFGDCTTAGYDGPDHIVTLSQDEKLAKVDEVIVPKDFYEKREIAPGINSNFLVARKGSTITREKATELGIT